MSIVVILGYWMPNLAAVTVTGALAGREGIQLVFRWYLVVLFPLPLAFVTAGLCGLVVGTFPGNMDLSVVVPDLTY
jgi:hypothetical protein